jgi:predicted HAD superfamily phosphohydrolase
METGDITVTLTESQHEMMMDVIMNAIEAFQLISPYDDGMHCLPLDNAIVQRYDTLDTLRETFLALWHDRFAPHSEYNQ